MQTVTQRPLKSLIGGKTGLKAKMWPNGEAVVWKARSFKPKPIRRHCPPELDSLQMVYFRWAILCPEVLLEAGTPLGSSTLTIFDKLTKGDVVEPKKLVSGRATKGLMGISSYGRRVVRNAAHLLQEKCGRARCVFATVTVPSLPVEQMRVVHERWHKVVELYRLGLRRSLQDKGLSGHSVSVTEVQEKRYEKTGLPALHLHTVFCGVTNVGRFAISTEQHDQIWFKAIGACVDIPFDEFSASCNLQRVRKSAASYLGKYMSKGVKVVESIKNDGLGSWLPRHWWNCSRALSREVKEQTRSIDDFAEVLAKGVGPKDNWLWEWHREVTVKMADETEISIARYGQLDNRIIADIRAYYSPPG